MEGLYSKTEKGHLEVEHKTAGLSPEMRRVLISVNGRRHIDELMMLPGVRELYQILNDLEKYGYISRTLHK